MNLWTGLLFDSRSAALVHRFASATAQSFGGFGPFSLRRLYPFGFDRELEALLLDEDIGLKIEDSHFEEGQGLEMTNVRGPKATGDRAGDLYAVRVGAIQPKISGISWPPVWESCLKRP